MLPNLTRMYTANPSGRPTKHPILNRFRILLSLDDLGDLGVLAIHPFFRIEPDEIRIERFARLNMAKYFSKAIFNPIHLVFVQLAEVSTPL